jgi:TRAP-type C4-dicarboxylate transport system substrate-binding protein
MHRYRALLLGLFAAASLAGSGLAQAQTKWDMPTPYPDTQYQTVNVRQFVDDVKKGSNGQLEIVVHSGQSLIKHPDILRAVQTGQVPIAEFLISQFSNEDPMFEVESLPFLAPSFDSAWKFYQAHKPYLEKRLQARGLRLLYSVAWPGQAIWSKNPVKSMDDFKGVKYRSYSPGTARMAELLGAAPTTVQLADVPQAFATNTVTMMITSGAAGVGMKAWEYSKFYYDTDAFLPRNVVVVNERAFQRLPEAVRTSVLKLAADAEKRGWDLARQANASALKTLSDNGVTVAKPDAAMTAAFAKIGETMVAEWQKKAGAEGEALIKAYRAMK